MKDDTTLLKNAESDTYTAALMLNDDEKKRWNAMGRIIKTNRTVAKVLSITLILVSAAGLFALFTAHLSLENALFLCEFPIVAILIVSNINIATAKEEVEQIINTAQTYYVAPNKTPSGHNFAFQIRIDSILRRPEFFDPLKVVIEMLHLDSCDLHLHPHFVSNDYFIDNMDKYANIADMWFIDGKNVRCESEDATMENSATYATILVHAKKDISSTDMDSTIFALDKLFTAASQSARKNTDGRTTLIEIPEDKNELIIQENDELFLQQ